MRCIIISGSPQTNSAFISSIVRDDDYVICADKGYYYAKLAGITPNLLVGDFDSYTGSMPDITTITLAPEKDDTDTEHCAQIAVQKGFKEVLIIGGLGGRLDHTLSNISVLFFLKSRGVCATLKSENETVAPLDLGDNFFNNLFGKTFSLFPFGCDNAVISIIGAKYPLDNGNISYKTSLGVSNVFTSNHSMVRLVSGNAVIIINDKI